MEKQLSVVILSIVQKIFEFSASVLIENRFERMLTSDRTRQFSIGFKVIKFGEKSKVQWQKNRKPMCNFPILQISIKTSFLQLRNWYASLECNDHYISIVFSPPHSTSLSENSATNSMVIYDLKCVCLVIAGFCNTSKTKPFGKCMHKLYAITVSKLRNFLRKTSTNSHAHFHNKQFAMFNAQAINLIFCSDPIRSDLFHICSVSL